MIPGYGERLKEARMAVGRLRNRIVSQALMAKLVTEELGRLESGKTVSQPQWSNYEAENDEPSTIVYRAAANISGITESYIAFGDPARSIELPDPAKDRKLSPEEEQRALRAADAEAAEQKRLTAAKRRGGRKQA